MKTSDWKKWGGVVAVSLLLFQTVSCNGSYTTSTGGGSDSGGSSSGTDSSGTSSGGSGTTGSGTTSDGFEISGQLASLSVSALQAGKGVVSGTVTDVMAVSPAPGGATCKTATVDSDGSFKVDLTGKRPWYFFFFNRQSRGRSMFLGRFLTSAMNTLVPATSTGSADLGNVTINAASETATSDKSNSDVIASLGLDSTTAESIGKVDEMARRYSNPDMDGDGEVDCKSSTNQYLLDFHVRYDMAVSNRSATVSDLIDQYFDVAKTTATYTNTGVYVSYPDSFSSASTGSVTFTESEVITSEAGTVPADTATYQVTNNDYGNFHSFGPNITKESELPSGGIVFTFGGKTLTFSDVKTPTLAQLTAPTGRIFPFIKFVKSDATCGSACTLSAIGYQWMKKTDGGGAAASLSELGLVIASKGGYISFRVGSDGDSSKVVGFTIPVTSVEGSLDWNVSNATLSGVTEAALKAMTTDQICHLGISYDDQIGMRYFEGVANVSGTCS